MHNEIAAVEVDLPGSVGSDPVIHRRSTVIDLHRVNPSANIATSDEPVMYLGIHSVFALDCPQPQFESVPLFSARVQEMFLDYRALRVSAFVSAFVAIGLFFIGLTDSFRASIFTCCLLYALFWMAVLLDRNIIALLFHEFEYVYCMTMFVVFLLAAVTQGIFVSAALAKYRNTDYSIAVFGSLSGDILWLIGSLLIITYVTKQ